MEALYSSHSILRPSAVKELAVGYTKYSVLSSRNRHDQFRTSKSFSLRAQADSAPAVVVNESAGPPVIDIDFLPARGTDEEVVSISIGSGTKNLRRAMLDDKIGQIYDWYGTAMNCGGGGSCGTCMVDVVEGAQLLSERTDAEDRCLKKRPTSWRLACQTIVGDKSNGGRLVIQRLPQKK